MSLSLSNLGNIGCWEYRNDSQSFFLFFFFWCPGNALVFYPTPSRDTPLAHDSIKSLTLFFFSPVAAGSGQIAGIASAIGVALLGAASSYFAYQKKKLCFKLQGGVDPESGKGQHGTHSDPQGKCLSPQII
uniref:CD99 molecule n=1 Tax=Myripristis murdjan TaxID=586833 RepID=A0A667XQL6_9TELE